MTEALDHILDAAEAQGDLRQMGLLGAAGKPTTEGVISEGLRGFRQGLEEKVAASERYSLRELPDGTMYVFVDTDQHLFDGVPDIKYNTIAKAYIIKRFKGKFVGKNNPAYVSGKTTKEYVRPANRRLTEDIRSTKMRASTEIDNVLDTARFIRHADDDGTNPEVIGGWDYYNVLFNVGRDCFEGIVNIKNIDMGRVLYDVTKIKNVTSSIIGGKAEANTRSASGGDILGRSIPAADKNSQELFSERVRVPL